MIAAAHRLATRLRHDRSGLAMMEFAFTLPLVIAIGGWGIELSFLALNNLRVSQYALTLADNASRVGLIGTGNVTQLREVDINDVLQGTRIQGRAIDLTNNARVTLSSLEYVQRNFSDAPSDTGPVQRIHWQRCMGVLGNWPGTGDDYESHYGRVTNLNAGNDTSLNNAGITAPNGMGDTSKKVTMTGLPGSAAMFVEINYRYKPVFGSMFVNSQVIHYTASFIVRDNRDYTRLYNPPQNPAVSASTCDKHNA